LTGRLPAPPTTMHGRSLRILQVANAASDGEWFYDQIMGLAELGHDVHVVLPESGPLSERFRSASMHVDIVPFMGKRLHQLPRIATAEWRLLQLVRLLRPDVIHAHLLKAVLSCRFAALGYRPALRVTQMPGTVHMHSRMLRWPDQWTVTRDDIVIGTCRAIADQYHAMGARSVAVGYYGCDVQRFDPRTSGDGFRREFGLTASTPTVGLVSRIYPTRLRAFRGVGVKGHEILLKAIPMILERMPGTHVFVVGDERMGNGEYRRRLEASGEMLGVSQNLHFTGHRTDIPAVLAAMDVVVSPSMEESACYAMVEALLMRRGVVASNVGGLPDTVQHGETGLLVPPGDPVALATAVTDLLADPAWRLEMGSRGRERCLRRFDLRTTVAEVEAIYMRGLRDLTRMRRRMGGGST
jgi:glycosyltransferase involved in cell wall biosynthesis